jgi:hypothetical protein
MADGWVALILTIEGVTLLGTIAVLWTLARNWRRG